MPFPTGSTLRYLRLPTVQLSEDLREGRIFSCFMHAWVTLGHYPQAREPTVLRVACQYVLSLRNIGVWPERPALHAGFDLWQGLFFLSLAPQRPSRQTT